MSNSRFRVHDRRDFKSGLMFIAVGVFFAIGALNYNFGSSARPGPAYFPFGLGLLLAALGALISFKACVGRSSQPAVDPGPVAWRPLGIIVAGITGFAITLPWLGIALALPMLVFIMSTASGQFKLKEVLLNAFVLTFGSWAVFVYGLGLILPVWPWFVR